MSQYLNKEDMLKDQLKQIADALGTAETGDALIEVARNAHNAEILYNIWTKKFNDLDSDIEEGYNLVKIWIK